MWPRDYQQRLADWVALRDRCITQSLSQCLSAVNQWWFAAPWQPYGLHWDDRDHWPDPWQLLADTVFCDVARGLGILYTVLLLERDDCADVQLVGTEQGNLVLIEQGKYVLNWRPDAIVNISSQALEIQTVLEPAVLNRITR